MAYSGCTIVLPKACGKAITMAAPAPIDLVFDVLPLAANSVLAKAVTKTARPSGRVALMDEVIMQGWPRGAALCLD